MEQGLHTILLIDDSYTKFIDGLSAVGKSYGFSIQAFASVREGIEFLNKNQNSVSAVLLDLSFTPNNFEGLAALQEIKKSNSLIPVLMLTGNQSEKDMTMAVECMKEGAFNYVVKTNFDPVSLFQMLKVAIAQYNESTERARHSTLKEEYRNRYSAYEKMIYTTEMILSNMLKDKLMFPPTFEGRVKEFKSFYEKVKQKEQKEGFITDPFKRFTDIGGIRVIVYDAADLQKAIDILKKANDFVDAKTGNKQLADDKSQTYGYRAVHFDVKLNDERLHFEEYKTLSDIPCEVQFKTIFAHSWSKVYHALSYKQTEGMNLTKNEQEQLGEDFKKAAKSLESIEREITSLCAKYHPKSKFLTQAN